MNFELWWLLAIPLVFAFGWAAARIDVRQMLSEQGALPRSYFKGLNFLLNEQPDKAIDAFIEVARLDPETVELHFALGSLFRRRGETERAIRVHQNLVNRPDLPASERDHALYELGQDFLRAGMLDRAEESLKLLMAGEYAVPAKRVLLELYQVEKEWRKAIDAARELREASPDDGLTQQIAQFCCELAQECIGAKKPEEAVQWLQQALAENPANVRANILLGDVAAGMGKPDEALQRWKSIEQQNAAYLPLVAERVMQASVAAGDAEGGLGWLRRQLGSRLGGELLDVAYKYERELAGTPAALDQMRLQMRRQPSFAALTKVYEAEVEIAAAAAASGGSAPDATVTASEDLVVARDLLKQRTRNLARYTCHECGFRARLFYWQCPGCSRWETYAPRRAEVAASGGASM
ncbi:lipopolysaccharide assembly protein LapB [Imbroritus primus]|uniref:Lipopolysaccharide assembly protein LapB n=1 Tax=Imbroritus primus TaxID=3058603 RepID=A0ACD3SV53_9BURK|nr:lipopolysaccharide assembly protein LapB [Burkholderiaceae bacterium PBA]